MDEPCPRFPDCDTLYGPSMPAQPPHTCPFKLEINDNDDLCTCCESCEHGCAMDI